MTVGYKAIRETFTSRVMLDPAALLVHAGSVPEYPSGPFRRVENRWTFAAAPGGCDVGFFIAYEFKSLMLQALVGGLFDRVFRRYTQAFEERARAVYGAPPRPRRESCVFGPARAACRRRASATSTDSDAHAVAADVAEAAFPVQRRPAPARGGQMHETDGLGLAAAAGAGDARHGDRRRPRARRSSAPSAMARATGLADGAVGGDQLGRDAEHLRPWRRWSR